MKARRLTKRKPHYLAWCFGIPFGGMLMIMLLNEFTPFGNSSMLYSDCYHQYYPFFKAYIQDIRGGESLIYSFNVGLGMDYLGLIAYYLASPLYLLGILVPDSMLLGFFSLLTPVRLGLAGLFFGMFLKKVFGKDDLSIAIFGSFYALCAWAMGYMWNVMWLDTFALLPLVAMGMYSLLTERKFMLYTIALALSVYANYYMGFFICIFVLLTFICYEICRFESFKKLAFDLAWMALFSVLAIGLTAFLELPAYSALQTTQSSVNKYPKDFDLNIVDRKLFTTVNADWDAAKLAWSSGKLAKAFSKGWSAFSVAFKAILNGMKQCAGNMMGGIAPTFKEGLPNLYCGVGTIIFAFLFLTCKQVKLREKLCTVALLLFLMLSFLIRQWDYIWHGFHFTNMIPYRFSFLFCFVILYMAYRAYLLRDEFKLWQILTAGGLVILLTFLSPSLEAYREAVSSKGFSGQLANILDNWSGKESDWNALSDHLGTYAFPVFNSLFLTSYLGILIYLYFPRKGPQKGSWKSDQQHKQASTKRRKLGATALATIMCIEIALNLINFATFFDGTVIDWYPRGKEDSERIYSLMDKREKDTLFYRAEATHSQTLNDGALNGYHGISTFTSSANVNITEFMKDLGYGAKNTYNRYCYEDSSPIANLFLGIKYMIERSGNTAPNNYFDLVASSGNVYLLENNAYLPLGFLANKELGTLDFSTGNDDFAFQDRLLSAAAGTEGNVWHYLANGELEISSDTVTISTSRSDGYCRYSASGSGTITYTYKPALSGLMCIDLNQSKRNSFTVWHNGKQLYSESYSLPQMLSVCSVQPGDTVEVRFSCKAGESGSITLVGAILDDAMFRSAYHILNASTLELTSFSNTQIKGTIECNRDGLLYTSIPQNDGNWSVKVDGKPAQIQLIGNCMIGVPLSEGYHTVTFQYTNSAFTVGIIISVISLIALLSLWVLMYKPDLKSKLPKKLREKLFK